MNASINQQNASSMRFPPQTAVVASVPKEAFKAMFYLFAGKPDSRVKLFKRRINIGLEDIKDLNRKVFEKLRLHQIEGVVATAVVRFHKGESIEFGVWDEFENFDWKTRHITKSISLKWDFLIKVPAFQTEQRHTLSVRLSTTPRPSDVFQMMISEDPDEGEVDDKIALCVARVDFISHLLADELINVVESWNDALLQPPSCCNWFCSLEKFDKYIARAIHASIPILAITLAWFALDKLIASRADHVVALNSAIEAKWLFASAIMVYLSNKLGFHLASKCYGAINSHGAFTPFRLTNGDVNENGRLEGRNKNQISIFVINCIVAFAINIAAGLAIWWCLPTTK